MALMLVGSLGPGDQHRPSASRASANSSWTWVEDSSAVTTEVIHLQDTASTIANAARFARVKLMPCGRVDSPGPRVAPFQR